MYSKHLMISQSCWSASAQWTLDEQRALCVSCLPGTSLLGDRTGGFNLLYALWNADAEEVTCLLSLCKGQLGVNSGRIGFPPVGVGIYTVVRHLA